MITRRSQNILNILKYEELFVVLIIRKNGSFEARSVNGVRTIGDTFSIGRCGKEDWL